MSGPRKVRVVAALIAHPEHPRSFLVQQRLPGGSRALLWEFPGGKVEQGESEEAALRRECHEELAVELQVLEKVWETQHTYPDLTVELLLYRAKITSGTPQPLGAHALRYATPEEMKALPFCEADIPLLDVLAEQDA